MKARWFFAGFFILVALSCFAEFYQGRAEAAAVDPWQATQKLQSQGNYKEAIAKLLAVEITYAYDTWRAASMLKVMECHLKLGNAERARYYRDELARKFPKSDCVPKADKLLAQAAKGEKPDVPKKKGAPGAEEPEP